MRLKMDSFQRWLAWRLPRGVVAWAFIRVVAHGTQGKYSNQIVPDLEAMEALKRWDSPNQIKPSKGDK